MKNKFSGIVTLSFINLFCIFLFPGCYYDNADSLYPGSNQPVNCATVPAKFGADISPLITAKCATAGCHNTTAAGGIILQNYTQISAAKNRINVRAVVEKSMPSSGPLSITEINSIKCWIESGAPNN
jgi:uncharacterized membrane protein